MWCVEALALGLPQISDPNAPNTKRFIYHDSGEQAMLNSKKMRAEEDLYIYIYMYIYIYIY